MELRARVIQAAEAALADHGYASFIDVVSGMQLLSGVQEWHNGRIEFLDETLQGSHEKIQKVIRIFHEWAKQRGLRQEDLPPHASFLRTPPKHKTASQFPEVEAVFRLHCLSPEIPEKKLEALRLKLSSPAPPTVFCIVKESKCAECQKELGRGEMLTMDKNQPLCLECADLDHLVFLESGDTALTRRATKHSSLYSVVVRFSRARGRYERQGILVQPEALRKAEEECESDAGQRATRQVRDAQRRREEDVELVARMAERIGALYPAMPEAEASGIASHTAARGSGRVGRSAAGRALDDNALELAVGAWVRHRHTRYDELLMRGVERADARAKVRESMDAVLDSWRPARSEAGVS